MFVNWFYLDVLDERKDSSTTSRKVSRGSIFSWRTAESDVEESDISDIEEAYYYGNSSSHNSELKMMMEPVKSNKIKELYQNAKLVSILPSKKILLEKILKTTCLLVFAFSQPKCKKPRIFILLFFRYTK